VIEVLPRSEQFTTIAGQVVPERIVPARIRVSGGALIASIVALIIIMRSA